MFNKGIILISALVLMLLGGCRPEQVKEANRHGEKGEEESYLQTDVKEERENEEEGVILQEEGQGTEVKTQSITQVEEQKKPMAEDSQENTDYREEHSHSWIEQTKTVTHKETGHWESKIDEEWQNDHYAWRTFCNKCGEDITDLGVEGITVHSAIVCESGYHAEYVIIKPYEGLPVMKEEWIVDEPAYTETIVTGYKCNCGATK